MTVTVTHTKVSAIPDGADATVVRPSDWNATHTLVGLGTAAELDAGLANGVATLDASGKVPSSQLTGVVTSVTGTAPVVSSGGTTPAISMAAASASANGYLTSADWTTFNSKGSGTVTSVSATSPVTSSGGATPTIAIPAATASVNGYLTSADWTTFNNKGSGSVTSVAATVPAFLSITGTPITSSGTLAISYSGTALPIANGGTGLTALGTGVQTAIGVNVGTAGAFVVNGGALGTPSSGTVTNLTGTASININGTVGATTANTGAFTSLSYSTTLTGGTGIVNLGSGQFYKDASGNVGIGTSSPTEKLDVNGNSRAAIATSGDVYFKAQNSAGSLFFLQKSASAVIYTPTSQPLVFDIAGERMRIDSSGNLLVGTTSAISSGKISVDSAASAFTAKISGVTGLGVGLDVERTFQNGDVAYFRSTTGLAGYISIVSANVCTYNSVSDIRLKKNIVEADTALTKIESLKVRRFDWKDDSGNVPYGFIAQELYEVAPEAVSQGTSQKDGSMLTPWGVDTSVLVPHLVKAIQEQQAMIAQLQSDVAALKGN